MTPTIHHQQALVRQAPAASQIVEIITVLKELGAETVRPFIAELIRQQTASAIFLEDERLALSFARSGYFADLTKANEDEGIAQAMTKIQVGRGWHMIPADAMRYIDFINGKPIIENEYYAMCMKASGIDWQNQFHTDPSSGRCVGCTLWPKHLVNGSWVPMTDITMVEGKVVDVRASVSFMKADADAIKIKDNGVFIPLSEKATYRAYPKNMYYWRAVANLRRFHAPNVLYGALLREEMDDAVIPVAGASAVPAPVAAIKEITGPITPAVEAKGKRGRSAVPRTEAPPVEGDPVPAPVEAATPSQLNIAAASQADAPSQSAVVDEPAPVTTEAQERDTIRTEILAMREKADAIGDGLFGTWVKESDASVAGLRQLLELPIGELREDLGFLRLKQGKDWFKNSAGAWVSRAF